MSDELFNYDDLNRVLARTRAMPRDVDSLFETWGINGPDLRRFLLEGAVEGREEYEAIGDRADVYASSMMVGFALGYQVAQELRMREEVKADDQNKDDG